MVPNVADISSACVDAGVHHIDLTGEPPYMSWVKEQCVFTSFHDLYVYLR
jgi:hypothetical protein